MTTDDHQFWTQSLNRPVDGSLFDVGIRQLLSPRDPVLKRLVQANDPDYTDLDSDPKQPDISHPEGSC